MWAKRCIHMFHLNWKGEVEKFSKFTSDGILFALEPGGGWCFCYAVGNTLGLPSVIDPLRYKVEWSFEEFRS